MCFTLTRFPGFVKVRAALGQFLKPWKKFAGGIDEPAKMVNETTSFSQSLRGIYVTTRPQPKPTTWRGVKGPVYADYLLAPLSTWKIGGPAEFLAVPQDLDDVWALQRTAVNRGCPLFFLGRGSNVLIADAGLPGITLHLIKSFQKLERQSDTVRVGAGVGLPLLAKIMADGGQGGFEFLAGIPGTVGAAVRLNAGAHGQDLGGILKRLWVVTPEMELRELTVAEITPGYRTSRLLRLPHWLVVEAEFVLSEEVSPAEIQRRMREFLEERRARQPSHPRTCGSVFKNPPGGPAAGRLIEEAGWKGKNLGAAQVSRKHANFIINRGGATAAEMITLMAAIEDSVWRRFGIRLDREVVFLPQDMQLRSDNLE
jgi:UDP-N-acetylmuramate dehydrogenase